MLPPPSAPCRASPLEEALRKTRVLLFLSSLSLELSYVMSGYRCFTCPVEFNNDTNSFTVDCEPSELFQLQEYNVPVGLHSVLGWVRPSVP